ncbi:hypothetical protein [Streptomyces sp. NPDC088910]|uniref:hypothetical protein n=1 Tax=Streptomyces sp. NPDC088910 TaxID=3365911 RepID=UPI00381F04B9
MNGYLPDEAAVLDKAFATYPRIADYVATVARPDMVAVDQTVDQHRIPGGCDGVWHQEGVCEATFADITTPGAALVVNVSSEEDRTTHLVIWEGNDGRDLLRTTNRADTVAFASWPGRESLVIRSGGRSERSPIRRPIRRPPLAPGQHQPDDKHRHHRHRHGDPERVPRLRPGGVAPQHRHQRPRGQHHPGDQRPLDRAQRRPVPPLFHGCHRSGPFRPVSERPMSVRYGAGGDVRRRRGGAVLHGAVGPAGRGADHPCPVDADCHPQGRAASIRVLKDRYGVGQLRATRIQSDLKARMS